MRPDSISSKALPTAQLPEEARESLRAVRIFGGLCGGGLRGPYVVRLPIGPSGPVRCPWAGKSRLLRPARGGRNDTGMTSRQGLNLQCSAVRSVKLQERLVS